MTPIHLSHTWSRRLYVGLFLLSLVYISLYALREFSAVVIPDSLYINIAVAGAAALVAVACVVQFLFVKKLSSFWPALITYGAFALITAFTVQHSGGVNSLFLTLWTLVVFFSPVFGAYGWVPILVLIGAYTGGMYLNNSLSPEAIILIVFSSFIANGGWHLYLARERRHRGCF
jgi:hypothetical protein